VPNHWLKYQQAANVAGSMKSAASEPVREADEDGVVRECSIAAGTIQHDFRRAALAVR
jgi:hypothetical protein